MKSLVIFLLTTSTAAIAAEPAYTCSPERGCKEEQGPTYDIGRGATLSLPFGWRFFSYPTAPDPQMAGLREFRATKNGMVIAITPFPNLDKRFISEDQLCEFVSKSGNQYVKQSKEQAITPVPMSRGAAIGCQTSFTAAQDGDKPFAVLPNRRHASVTTFAISHRYIIFSVSVVSEQAPDEDFRAAISSIQQIQ